MRSIKSSTVRLVLAAMFSALICLFTLIPTGIPSLTGGYIHLGDCFVLLAGWFLGPLYAPLAAGIGSALADVICGYAIYAPATLVIKAAVALIAALFVKAVYGRKNGTVFIMRTVGGIIAECIMAAGYYLYSASVMGYGWGGAALDLPNNAVQGGIGIIAALIIAQILTGMGLFNKIERG